MVFQAEDGIRDPLWSRGLGDVYKRQGTITANFDGQKKHQTKIGKNSSIGANTVFVAPINLGESVTTGAGSVITKDSKDNSLAISRTKPVSYTHLTLPTIYSV